MVLYNDYQEFRSTKQKRWGNPHRNLLVGQRRYILELILLGEVIIHQSCDGTSQQLWEV